MRCPSCHKWITWLQKWKFSKGLGSRKVSQCPNCGTSLIWAKWPFRLVTLGCTTMLLGGIAYFLIRRAGGDMSILIYTVPSTILVICGLLRLKFIVVTDEDQ
jgi:hypothetical protein